MNSEIRPWIQDSQSGSRRAGVNAFGFGGINVHLVLEEVPVSQGTDDRVPLPRPIRVPAVWPAELFVFSAKTRDDLMRKLHLTCEGLTAESDWRAVEVARALSREFDQTHACKLAIVCGGLEELSIILTDCRGKLAKGQTKLGNELTVFYSESAAAPKGKVAVIFPGNGFPGIVGEFPDHLRTLAIHFPLVRREIDFLSARDHHPEDPMPLEAILWPPAAMPDDLKEQVKQRLYVILLDENGVEHLALPKHRQLDTMCMAMSNWIRWQMLEAIDLPADMLTGLSLGEMTASCSAGCYDYYKIIHPYLESTLGVGNEILRSSDCRMLFLFAPKERFAKIQHDYPRIRVSIELASDAVCIAGPQADLKAIERELREDGLISKTLPFPPVHTEYFNEAKRMLEEAFDPSKIECQRPRLPMYSSFLAERYPEEPEQIRQLLYRNIVEPLRIPPTLRLMYDDGARLFILAGIGQLSMLSAGVLPAGAKIETVAIDVEAADPVVHFQRMCGMLLTSGVPLSFDVLYEHRDVRPINLDRPESAVRRRHDVPLRMDWSPLENAPMCSTSDAEFQNVSESELESDIISDDDASDFGSPPEEQIPLDVLAAAEQLPLIGQLIEFEPDRHLVCERTFSLEDDCFLLDHLFIYAPGIKPPEERWPVVPMSFSLELFAEAGALLSPGMQLIGLESVKMSRWIDVTESGPKTVRATARVLDDNQPDGIRRVEVSIAQDEIRLAKGTALFAVEYREDLDIGEFTPVPEIPWPVTAEQTYDEGLMFHGPMLQAIHRLDGFGDHSCSAEMIVLPKGELFRDRPDPVLLTDPCLMDGISQICGLWLQMKDSNVFPTGVERVEFYQPTPAEGTVTPCRFELTAFDPDTKQFRFKGEVEDGAGGLWIRVAGWCDWLFPYTPRFAYWTLRPTELMLGEEIELPDADPDSVCIFLSRKEVRIAGLERAWRTALTSMEAAELLALPSEDLQRDFVISRIAAKDAARLWWERVHHHPGVHPAHIEVREDEHGRPYVVNVLGLPDPEISFAYSVRGAIALASSQPVAVELEPADSSGRHGAEESLTDEELAQIESFLRETPAADWPTRVRCAKQVAAKLLTHGVLEEPADYCLVEADADESMWIRRRSDGESVLVRTALFDGTVIAWSGLENCVSADGSN